MLGDLPLGVDMTYRNSCMGDNETLVMMKRIHVMRMTNW
jgi:hypothetical protein